MAQINLLSNQRDQRDPVSGILSSGSKSCYKGSFYINKYSLCGWEMQI